MNGEDRDKLNLTFAFSLLPFYFQFLNLSQFKRIVRDLVIVSIDTFQFFYFTNHPNGKWKY